MSSTYLNIKGFVVVIVSYGMSVSLSVATEAEDRGKLVFQKRCAVCHSILPEVHKEGPSLAGIYGRRAGTVPFFAGYQGLKGATIVWEQQSLDSWLLDPRGFLGGRDTRMSFRLEDDSERADVIVYMKTLR
jgi:cytochrome c